MGVDIEEMVRLQGGAHQLDHIHSRRCGHFVPIDRMRAE
jgi:hypothetical protein